MSQRDVYYAQAPCRASCIVFWQFSEKMCFRRVWSYFPPRLILGATWNRVNKVLFTVHWNFCADYTETVFIGLICCKSASLQLETKLQPDSCLPKNYIIPGGWIAVWMIPLVHKKELSLQLSFEYFKKWHKNVGVFNKKHNTHKW